MKCLVVSVLVIAVVFTVNCRDVPGQTEGSRKAEQQLVEETADTELDVPAQPQGRTRNAHQLVETDIAVAHHKESAEDREIEIRITCENKYDDRNCQYWADSKKYCTTGPYVSWMATNCFKACNKCLTCENKYDDRNCQYWADSKEFCTTGPYVSWMATNCMKACNKCPLVEIDFKSIGGEAKATSDCCLWIPSHAFLGPGHAWHTGTDTALPQSLWYEFPVAKIIKKFSFMSRPDISSLTVSDGPSKYTFWGSNNQDCSDESTWDILFEDLSGTKFDENNTPKEEVVNNNIFYKCYGFKVLETSQPRGVSTISNVRMYSTIYVL